MREGIALALAEGVDFLLPVGGGSVIDSAKAIAYALAEPDKDVWELFEGKRPARGCLPLGCVLFEERAILYAYEEGTKPFEVAGWAGWDSRGVQPDSPMMQKTYLWSVADPKY